MIIDTKKLKIKHKHVWWACTALLVLISYILTGLTWTAADEPRAVFWGLAVLSSAIAQVIRWARLTSYYNELWDKEL